MDNNNDWRQDDHWKVISAGGVQISTTPEQLWEQAVSYFKWCTDNPIKPKKTLTSGKEAGKQVEMVVARPFTIEGMCLHCGINRRYITEIEATHGKDSKWYMVMEKILMVIYTQNLEGGLADLYNPIMVSKVLKLDAPQENNTGTVKVEIVHSEAKLANSENEVLRKLNPEKLEIIKDKSENSEREITS